MISARITAKIAGLLYLLLVITGAFSLIVVPGKLYVLGDPSATARNILSAEPLFRMHILNQLVSLLVFLALACALYALFVKVHAGLSAIMFLLVAIQIPLGLHDVSNQVSALELLHGDSHLASLSGSAREALAMLYLDLGGKGAVAAQLFWGLWLVPLGILCLRSGWFPKLIGVWLLLNSVAYAAISLTGLMLPQQLELVEKVVTPGILGEIVFMLWLLIRGVPDAGRDRNREQADETSITV